MSAEQPELADRPSAVETVAERSAPVADGSRPGFSDTLTLAFADSAAGIAAFVVAEHRTGARAAAGVGALVFAEGRLLTSIERDGLEPSEPRWEALGAESLRLSTSADRWRVVIDVADAELELELEFAPSEEPSGFGDDSPVGRVSGLTRTQRRCAVAGAAVIGGEERRLAGVGERAHQWGPPAWDRLEAWRAFGAWLGEDLSIALWSGLPIGATRDREALAARVVEGVPARAHDVGEPRLSVTYDAEGELLRAGLELWVGDDDDFARRAAGERLAAGSLRLCGSRHRWALLDCRVDGRSGPGALHVATPEGAAS